MNNKIQKQKIRDYRVKSKINQKTNLRPRLTVFRSNRYIYVQIIDDTKNITLASASNHNPKNELKTPEDVGKAIAEKALSLKVKEVVFDRGRFAFHGQVKKLAESARINSLNF